MANGVLKFLLHFYFIIFEGRKQLMPLISLTMYQYRKKKVLEFDHLCLILLLFNGKKRHVNGA